MAAARPPNIKTGSALRAALIKLLGEVRRSLDTFCDDPSAKAHFIRTRIKRLQSLSQLIPHAPLWRKEFRHICMGIKDLFAPLRDWSILRGLAETYAPGQALLLEPPAAPDLEEAARISGQALKQIELYTHWDSVKWRGILLRATATYRVARGAWKHARRTNAPDDAFHLFRRRLKRLLYQCEYLTENIRLARFTKRVDRLGGILGDIQDICLAEDWLKNQRGIAVPADLSRSKAKLRRDSLRRAETLLSPRAKDFRSMLGPII